MSLRSLATLAALALSVAAHAGVNVNNGNFYIANTDFFLATQGLSIDVTRTYNSRSSYVKGWFGVGWSSELEGRLETVKDGVDYYEGGGGNIVHFSQSGKSAWSNGLYGLQTLSKRADGAWLLKTATGKQLVFNAGGKLSRIMDVNGNGLDLVWKADRLDMIRDNFNNQVKFYWGDFGGSGRVVRVERDNMKVAYGYGKQGSLLKATGIDGVTYEYSYDDEFNMTKIGYADGSYKEMGYNKTRDWITKFRDRDGMTTSYDYFSDSLDPESKFGTVVTRAQEGSKDRDVSKFWYEFRKRADGSRFNYRAVTAVRDQVTESIFTECCGTPLVISQWSLDPKVAASSDKLAWTVARPDKESTAFEYYADGLLKKKTASNGQVTALEYDGVHKKVSSVQKGDRKISYSYDKAGNLLAAYDHAGKRNLGLKYDPQGRISVVEERVGVAQGAAQGPARFVFFRYDGSGRPIEIKERAPTGQEGVIRMAYNARGEVQGVFNAQGRALASDVEVESARQVALTFQNLLEIVQPAGVSLAPEG
jgi:YD repeat-containing protein